MQRRWDGWIMAQCIWVIPDMLFPEKDKNNAIY